MLARIKNGELQYGLPIVSVLNDERSVSHYDLLPSDILADEGWKEVVENAPELTENEYLIIDSFNDNGTNIIINYRLEAI